MLKRMLKKVKKIVKKMLANHSLDKILIKSNTKKIIYIGSPLHGNIGDHAISIAITDLLKEYDIPTIEIPGEYFVLSEERIINYVNKEDIIIITGGGLIGNLWMNEEEMVKKVISSFKDNKILIMPQTYYFDNNAEGKKELSNLKKIVDSHNNIYLCSREKKSYDLCQKNFKKVKGNILLPDVVLTLNFKNKSNRKDILIVLRKDKEKFIDQEKIFENIKLENMRETTTVINKGISIENRNFVFDKKIQEFLNAKLVITDRLHAMIFAAITGTPCVALDNKSKKVSGVYEWLKDLEYIKFCNSIEDINKNINNINLKKEYKYNLFMEYRKLIKEILDIVLEVDRRL